MSLHTFTYDFLALISIMSDTLLFIRFSKDCKNCIHLHRLSKLVPDTGESLYLKQLNINVGVVTLNNKIYKY